MSRREENEEMRKAMSQGYTGDYESVMVKTLGAITGTLIDISRSLAVIADSCSPEIPDLKSRIIVHDLKNCNTCRHYDGVKEARGCAPCNFFKNAFVMWNDGCKRYEDYREEDEK